MTQAQEIESDRGHSTAQVKIFSIRGPAMFSLFRDFNSEGKKPDGLSKHILVISPAFVDAVAQGAPWTILDPSSGKRLHDSAQNILRAVERMKERGLSLSGTPDALEALKKVSMNLAPPKDMPSAGLAR